ncbi:alpha/beta fold hydrolase [Haloarchaeobius sp. FL176]|uniref:alpha/beta fold hydrolase n=1 Tax=Haloarchaeobius sp. FL176 TaxID=2967129 RepID=UPI0034E977B6
MPDVEHDQTIVNDVRLHYVEAGDPDDETVVLLHGFPEYWYTWHRQLPALADAGYHVVAPDMRGYNTSEKPHGKDAYTLGRLSRDVVGLVEAFGETGHVVGHDWGGRRRLGYRRAPPRRRRDAHRAERAPPRRVPARTAPQSGPAPALVVRPLVPGAVATGTAVRGRERPDLLRAVRRADQQ